jgi:hypothetical protein
MNQAAAYMQREPETPNDEQDYGDRPKHDGILARSELYVVTGNVPASAHSGSTAWALCQRTLRTMATNMPELPRSYDDFGANSSLCVAAS